METLTVLSIGFAAVVGGMAGVMLIWLDSVVRRPAPAAGWQRPPQRKRA
jgi:hypothetical protein